MSSAIDTDSDSDKNTNTEYRYSIFTLTKESRIVEVHWLTFILSH